MSNGDDVSFKIEADGSSARSEIKSVYDLLAKLSPVADKAGKSLDEVGSDGLKSLAQYATTLERVDALLDNLETRQARSASTRSKAESSAYLGQSNAVYGDDTNRSKAALAAQKVLNSEAQQEIALRQQANRDIITESQNLLIAANIERVANQQRIDNLREADRQAKQLATTEQTAARNALRLEQQRRAAILERAKTERSSALAAERAAATQAQWGATPPSGRRSAAVSDPHDVSEINATRYALYDVAQTATLVGTAISGVGIASIAAATQAEASFADVQRAMDVPAEKAASLKQDLLDLTTSMPTSFTDVAGVAQLGAQLGVANSDLDSFTESVVKFSATTNVSTEAAGTAFGRLSQLLKVPQTEFENLSSSIYQVGIDSVATESEIISTSTQIAGAAAAYNFTADEVVGLSAAFASLGIAPEAARGSVTRIFGDIEKAVSAGGDALEPYNKLLGTTTKESTDLWNTDPSAFFSKLVKGLSQSSNLLSDLSDIGANDVRDVNLLQRLSQNSDFLATSLKTAKSAYDDGTATSKGYAVTSATVAAKVTELINAFTKLAIAAGSTLLGPLGAGIDLLKGFVDTLSNANPIILGIVTVLTLLVGGFVLLRAAQAATMAGILALRFVLQQLGATGSVTGINMASLRGQIALLRTEMTLTATEGAATAGGIDKTSNSAKSARSSIFSMSSVMRGVGWAAAISGAVQLANSLLKAYYSSKQAADGLRDIQNASYAVSGDKLVSSFTKANAVIKDYADGFNGRKGMDQKLLYQVDSFAGAWGNSSAGLKNAKAEIAAIDQQLAQMVSNGNVEGAANAVKAIGLSANETKNTFPGYTSALQTAAQAAQAQGGAAADAAGDNDALAGSVDGAKGSLDGLFGSISGGDFASAIQQLFSGIYDAGTSFNYLSENGRANLANLQGAMEQTIAEGKATGQSATTSVALLFQQLAKAGVDTHSLLVTLASAPIKFRAGIDFGDVTKQLNSFMSGAGAPKGGTSKQTSGFMQLQGSLYDLATTAPKASNGLSGVGKAAKKAAKGAGDAAKEVKTLNDYASDLSTVFNDAKTYRFGVSDALDDISGKWGDIKKDIDDNNSALLDHKKDIADARLELAGYRADLGKLRADLSTQKYFLKIAVQYGDTLRGNEIGADIADLNAQIADKQNDVNKAQKDATAPFKGTTNSILEQRESLGSLYDAYQKAIEEYARSGLTQAQLSVKVEQLRQDFVRQATQAGYSKAEIDRYSQAFRDLTTVINGVPRKITVTANTDPAMRALNDFLAKANAAKAKASIDAPDAGAAGSLAASRFTSNFDAWFANWQNSFNGTKRAIDQITRDVNKIKIPDLSNLGLGLGFQVGGARGMFTPGKNAFPIGGFVPGNRPSDRRKDNMRGLVAGGGIVGLQGGEPIINNAARSKYGDDLFNDINALRYSPQVIRPQVTVQGGGGGMMELSPYDRQLLIDIRNAAGISIPATALQQAANAGNTSSARRRQG